MFETLVKKIGISGSFFIPVVIGFLILVLLICFYPRWRKKYGLKIIVCILLLFMFWPLARIGWVSTPEINGVVVDETTKAPIENVTVFCKWTNVIFHSHPRVHDATVVTNEDGEFEILEYFTWVNIFKMGSFRRMSIKFMHPYYQEERVRFTHNERNPFLEDLVKIKDIRENPSRLTIKMTSLDSLVQDGEWDGFHKAFRDNVWNIRRFENYKIRIILNRWEEMINRISDPIKRNKSMSSLKTVVIRGSE